jgi:hypothetical protein|eukprot:SAG25_NODE_85_length_16527_cov_73.409240_15_plen_54_part_00
MDTATATSSTTMVTLAHGDVSTLGQCNSWYLTYVRVIGCAHQKGRFQIERRQS